MTDEITTGYDTDLPPGTSSTGSALGTDGMITRRPVQPTPADEAAMRDLLAGGGGGTDGTAAPDAAATTPRKSRRRRWLMRIVFYAIATPVFIWAALAAYAELTRLPDLENDLAVLLPRDATLLYAELPSPADLLPALQGTHVFNAFTGRDDNGMYTTLQPLPDDDERSLRKANEQVNMFRMMTGMMPQFFDASVVYAVVRWPDDDTVANYFLTRSEPSAVKQLMPMIGMLAPGMKTEKHIYRDVPYNVMLKYDDGELEDAFQFVQLGNVFAFVWGSAERNHTERMIEAWYRDDRRGSHYADVVAARQRIEEQRPAKEGDREWLFATLRGREFAEAALDVAEGHLARSDENDALDWVGYAKWAGRLGNASLIARSHPVDIVTPAASGNNVANATNQPRTLELAMVCSPPGGMASRGGPSEWAPPEKLPWWSMRGEVQLSRDKLDFMQSPFEIEVSSARALTWIGGLLFKGKDERKTTADHVDAAIRQCRAGLNRDSADIKILMRAMGNTMPDPVQGTISRDVDQAALTSVFNEAGFEFIEEFEDTKPQWTFHWPRDFSDLDRAEWSPTIARTVLTDSYRNGEHRNSPDHILTFFLHAGDLNTVGARQLLLALTANSDTARARRTAMNFLSFLRDAPAWHLSAINIGDNVFVSLRSERSQLWEP